jgi:nitroimidazol reductase NimA-like FMN-containing flavoprotein (pyridoxamine 5'-phosphate oxidase superfamily)
MSRTDATRMSELMSRDRAALNALLDAVIVAHIAYVTEDGTPGVLPTAIARDGDELIVHGSTGSRWMRLVAGAPAAVSVTAVDGVVVARSAFESSLIYRSAVLFGSFRRLDGAEKEEALDALTDRLIPGRVAEVRASTKKELAATLVLALPITEWSLRISDDWSEDDEDDVAGPAWAGMVRFGERTTQILDAPGLRPGIPTPDSVLALRSWS